MKQVTRGGVISPDAPFETACLGLLSTSDQINIVQVGANDGKWGDPLFDIAQRFSHRTQLLLCEPQPELVDKLKENYRDHPNVRFFEGAVGRPDSDLTFFRVKPEYWESLDAPYLKEAPAYRAPTGLASFDKRYLVSNLGPLSNKADGSRVEADTVIEEVSVEVVSLESLLQKYPEMNPVDVLVIDVEGLDHEIILDSVSRTVLPRILLFESQHLSPNEEANLLEFLRSFEYESMKLGGNTLAIRAQNELT